MNALNQPLTKEQIEEQEAFNRSAQFFAKQNALAHQPTVQQMQRDLEADAWPWPMSQDAQRLVKQWDKRTRFQCVARGCDGCMVCEPQKFNRAEHERFMRGLG